MIKKGFTIAEMLVCLVIIGVISVMMLVSIKAKPNENMVMFRKAYNLTSNNVYEMINNEEYYSAENGFKDVGEPQVDIGGEPRSNFKGLSKFCKIFSQYLNTQDIPDCSSTKTLDAGGNFTTLDGIVWSMPVSDFSSEQIINVDLNGSALPNCTEGANCTDPDRFSIGITSYGKIKVPSEKGRSYLRVNRNITK